MNHPTDAPAYGLWTLVFINSAIFIAFAYSFFTPRTGRDWRTFGGFAAFVVALFAEMYGFPLTIYLLSGWLVRKFPGVDLFSHEGGHIWYSVLGFRGDPHANPVHVLSNVLIVAGFFLLASAWRVLYQAQKDNRLASSGPYAVIRHPQYAAFGVIMLGFLAQWPTLVTLVMFPILVAVYVRLARREETDARRAFGRAWEEYAARTPGWIPRLRRQHEMYAGGRP
ncbi:isoprenylcysteine carboxylmethyltransferase family protein [bacterium]|nr:isoprenylcysteine carboxylmethyltransferase family protein [bacterium]